jgi:16S rRNA (adenine1518-N6/adenine1519-N6)-dimethyltransferase
VQSAVIRMTRNQVEHLGCDEQLFKRVVKSVFNQRRKMLRVSLKQLLPATALSSLSGHPFMSLRPEQLSIVQFVELTNMVEKVLGE